MVYQHSSVYSMKWSPRHAEIDKPRPLPWTGYANFPLQYCIENAFIIDLNFRKCRADLLMLIQHQHHDAVLHFGKVVLSLLTNADYTFAHPNTRIANHSMCQPPSPLTTATPPLALHYLATLLLIKLFIPAALVQSFCIPQNVAGSGRERSAHLS
ncbi:hypothetical protein ARMSODRAFT_665882 [Armillaria solidipes]|uniref:Uncharacterized protein n=1 Tax=Armillaria solidipes TaxID=1076256 RepID=A0A2H3AXJ8_9AGAR|nr:hypothetical protein ARMSODRAFT_665882 [Armillaria solidipes]